MKTSSPALPLTGLIFVIQALFFTGLTLMLSDVIQGWEALDVKDVLIGCGVLNIVGTGLAACGFRHPIGKIALGIGVLVFGIIALAV
jgi:hypothetical protein